MIRKGNGLMRNNWAAFILLFSGICIGAFDADLDTDKYVGIGDLAFMASYWLDHDNPGCNGDTGSDCQIDMEDLAVLSQQWQWMECVSSASASSQESSSLGPENAIDGSMSTRWSSAFEDNQWLQIDLGQARNIYGLTIYWETAYATVYNVQISNNAADWTTVYSEPSGNGGTDDINFTEQSMHYIRINCVDRSTQYGSSIWEVELKSDDCCQDPPPPDWELVWSDEFDGTSLNMDNWSYQIMGDGGNNEWQYYTSRPQNSWVSGGYLTIQANKEDYVVGSQTYHYTSARIRTAGKQDFLYGRLEGRIKVPKGQGIWPAFWMMPTDSEYGGWAACGEIDIMETINQATSIYGTLHYGGEWPYNESSGCSYSNGLTDYSQDFHVYTIEWEPTVFRWYVDGQLYCMRTSWWSSGGDYPAPFDQLFHFILNVAVGGNWPGYPDETTVFPQQMVVDYVRVYQKTE